MENFPIVAFYHNMIKHDDGTVWAYYRVPSEFVMAMDYTTKEKLKKQVRFFFDELAIFQKIDIKLLPRDMTLAERFADVLQTIPEATHDVAKTYLDRVFAYLKNDLGQPFVYDWVIGVPLDILHYHSLKSSVDMVVRKGFDKLIRGLRLRFKEDDWQQKYIEMEEHAYRLLNTKQVTRLTEEEMRYLTRLPLIRGMQHTLESEKIHLTNEQLVDGVLDFSKAGVVKLENYEGVTYVACLPLSETKYNLDNMNLAENVQKFSFPIELHYQLFYEKVHGVGLKYKARRSQRNVDTVVLESVEASGDFAGEVVDAKEALNDLENRIDAKEVMVGWQVMIVVSADSLKTLNERCADVMSYFNQQRIYFVRGTGDQHMLFMRSFFGQLNKETRYWYHYTNTETFAENLLFTNNRIGTRSGFYIGRVDTRFEQSKNIETAVYNSSNIVLLNPTIINKGLEGSQTDSPHIAVTGETGTGKTFLILLLFFYMSFYVKTLFIDVKNEKKYRFMEVISRPEICEQYPYLVEHVEKNISFITLDVDDEKNHGVIDPFVFLDVVDAKSMAETLLYQLYDFEKEPEYELALLRSIDKVVVQKQKNEQVGLLSVVDVLLADEDSKISKIGELMIQKIKNSLLELIFSRGDKQTISFDNRNTIVGIKALDIPKVTDDTKDYTPSQIKSLMVLAVLGKFSEQFGAKNPFEETATFIDEAWYYFRTKIGQSVLKSMKRTGRSYNNQLVLGTQSVYDMIDAEGKEQADNFGLLFAFDEPTERQEILKHLRLPVTEDNEQFLANLIKGQCLFLDNYGHCNKLSVHCPFPEVLELFKTVDKTELSELESKFV